MNDTALIDIIIGLTTLAVIVFPDFSEHCEI